MSRLSACAMSLFTTQMLPTVSQLGGAGIQSVSMYNVGIKTEELCIYLCDGIHFLNKSNIFVPLKSVIPKVI